MSSKITIYVARHGKFTVESMADSGYVEKGRAVSVE